MQKVFGSCYPLDKQCYEKYKLTEEILMEHAARGMASYIQSRFDKGSSLLIVAGAGNNGADGIVLARQLYGEYKVRLMLPFGVRSEMAKLQWQRAEALGIEAVEALEEADVIVDAVFGAGLNRPLNGATQKIIETLNTLKGFKIACDVPSGVSEKGQLLPMAFEADVTLTMGALKEALYLDESKDHVGEVICADLGIAAQYYEMQSRTSVLEACDLDVPGRSRAGTHKGSFGHAGVFCGEKEGAGIIAALAASRYGAGLTTLIVHEVVQHPPHLMHATIVPEKTSALAIGMGLGGHFDSDFLKNDVIDSTLPVLLDADSFSHPELLSILEQEEREIVITPHPKEFAAMWALLTGECFSVEEVQSRRFEMARMFSRRYPKVTLLLKGATMLIIQEERLCINPLGSAKLSKGGSGDVLSGLIAALLAQGYSSMDAAIQGSLALVMAAKQYRGADYAMLSTDIIDGLSSLK